ncbi:hypothetical protein AVEN_242641-1 [Araneus ventricosus]|uniref:Uncharacterized protein n=1 Tax=Araneus ventricosus TaxID=182803 RepID=A0A4Y2N7V6_ARAVE|nr:hypothetical protein AVEN_242641-1 [Araneus ventricosus]
MLYFHRTFGAAWPNLALAPINPKPTNQSTMLKCPKRQKMMLQNPAEHASAFYLLLPPDGYQSSLWSTEDFHYNFFISYHFHGRSLRSVFLISTARRLTALAIRRQGSEATCWGSASICIWLRSANEVRASEIFFNVYIVEVLSAGSITIKNNFPLSTVEHNVSWMSTVETNWDVVSCSPYISFSRLSWWAINWNR